MRLFRSFAEQTVRPTKVYLSVSFAPGTSLSTLWTLPFPVVTFIHSSQLIQGEHWAKIFDHSPDIPDDAWVYFIDDDDEILSCTIENVCKANPSVQTVEIPTWTVDDATGQSRPSDSDMSSKAYRWKNVKWYFSKCHAKHVRAASWLADVSMFLDLSEFRPVKRLTTPQTGVLVHRHEENITKLGPWTLRSRSSSGASKT